MINIGHVQFFKIMIVLQKNSMCIKDLKYQVLVNSIIVK
jgi:hypothetical protein